MKKIVAIIVIICCVFGFSACEMDAAESDEGETYSENAVQIPFSHEYVYDKHFSEIEKQLRDLGFSDIKYNVSKMNYDLEENFDGRVVGVHFDGEWEFDAGDCFEPNTPIIISYVVDMGITVPATSEMCKGMQYVDVVKLFADAGFTNVTAYPLHPDDITGLVDGSVRFVSIDYDDSFTEGSKFEPDAVVEVYYHELTSEDSGEENTDTIMVWISETGSKYHSSKYCSDMENPAEVSKEKAEQMGYTPCKKCH